MKKLRLLSLLLVLLCLCATAFAAGVPGQMNIAVIEDRNGNVTDDDTATAWTIANGTGAELTIELLHASVGEIWIRNGYAYTQNWYNHYDRAATVKVTVFYGVNQYTTSYDSYRYQLEDAFRPNTRSSNWHDGYQRLLLPRQYANVSKIVLTIESVVKGVGNAGLAIADIALTAGSHATATPRTYATATPKPYIVYITPTPNPDAGKDDDYVEYITPIPDDYVELITPIPEDNTELITPAPDLEPLPSPTEPLVELITPPPTSVPVEYPSVGGVVATLSKRIATRSGPGLKFDEPGSFFSEGDEVKVISHVYDEADNVHWLQVEFLYDGQWYRAYTPNTRVNVDLALVPNEPGLNDPIDTRIVLEDVRAAFGPGYQYAEYRRSMVYAGYEVDIYAVENGWVQIEYVDYAVTDMYVKRRGWVPMSAVYGE